MILDTIWQEFLTILTVEVGSRVVETWFKAITLVSWDARGKEVRLRAPNQFTQDWVHNKYQKLFAEHLARLLNEERVSVVFVDIETSANTTTSTQAHTTQNATHNEQGDGAIATDEVAPVLATSRAHEVVPFAKNHLFETFVVGPCNSIAFAAAHAVTQNVGKLYNPLIIAGGSGLGKTHLLHAIGNRIRIERNNATVLYQSADRFVNEYVAAVRAERIPQFEAKYKTVDVLLMDDIQFMSNKERSQEMFFQIFTSLRESRKQIVFTCDVAPRHIAGFNDRLRSRLESGLVADLHEADHAMRVSILKHKCAAQNVELDDSIVNYIATQSEGNVRDLEGGLIRVLAYSTLTRQEINTDLVGKVLAHAYHKKQQAVDLNEVIKQVASYFNHSVAEIRSPKRSKDLAKARHIAVYLMKRLTTRSLREIAHFLDRKDHSTIIHAYDKIEAERKKDVHFAQTLERLEKSITTPR